jgi:dGTPase
MRAGLLVIESLGEAPLVAKLLDDIRREYPVLSAGRTRAELVRRLISAMIGDVVAESRRRLAAACPRSSDAVRLAPGPLVSFSPAMQANDAALKAMLGRAVYRHARVAEAMVKAERIAERLFDRYLADEGALPETWRPSPGADETEHARAVADFIAGMTDRYAIAEYRRLFAQDAGLGEASV